MGKSKHRPSHKQKVQKHKTKIQTQRIQFQRLLDQLEVEMIKAQMDQPQTIKVMEDQPTLYLTGSQSQNN